MPVMMPMMMQTSLIYNWNKFEASEVTAPDWQWLHPSCHGLVLLWKTTAAVP
jgi:hypothetical protein